MNAGIGDNNPPTDEQAFQSELEGRNASLLERRTQLLEAAERAPETIEDADTAGKAADFLKQLVAHEKAAEKARKDEKEPYFQRGKWVDAYFKGPAVAGIAEVKKKITGALSAYQREEARKERLRREEEERRQREEARRAAEEAEEKAAAAKTEDDLDAAVQAEEEAAAAQAQAERAERATQAGAADLSRTRSDAGTVASLRTVTKCTAWRRPDLDLNALRPYFGDADIEKAIRGYIRAGGRELKGATIEEIEESRVA